MPFKNFVFVFGTNPSNTSFPPCFFSSTFCMRTVQTIERKKHAIKAPTNIGMRSVLNLFANGLLLDRRLEEERTTCSMACRRIARSLSDRECLLKCAFHFLRRRKKREEREVLFRHSRLFIIPTYTVHVAAFCIHTYSLLILNM